MKKKFFCIIFVFYVLWPLLVSAVEPYEIIRSNNYQDPIEIIYETIGPGKNYLKEKQTYYSHKNYKHSTLSNSFFDFDKIITKAAKKYNVPFLLIKAMIQVESNFNSRAVSNKGAKGLMQVMPENFDSLGINDPFNPVENIMGGTKYLKLQLKKFNRLDKALAAYNAGPDEVIKNNGVPPFNETNNYVKKVQKLYNIFTLSEKLSIESKTKKGGTK